MKINDEGGKRVTAYELWHKLREPISGTPAEMMVEEQKLIAEALQAARSEGREEAQRENNAVWGAAYAKGREEGFAEAREEIANIAEFHSGPSIQLAIKIRALRPTDKE